MENLYKLKEDFLAVWSEEKVKEMTLEDYTNLNKDNSFCYWLESRTTDLGSIWGGSAYKFGIYKRSDVNKELSESYRKTDGEYAWHVKYGATKEEAFESLKNIILEIINSVKKGDLQKIDKIDLGPAYKWKIAFLYSNFNIINIFKYDALKYLSEKRGFDFKKRSSVSDLQNFLLNLKQDSDEFFTYSHKLWKEYEDSTKKDKPAPKTTHKQLFIDWLVFNMLDPEIAEELDMLSGEVLRRGTFEKHIYECIDYNDVYKLQFIEPIDQYWDSLYVHYLNFSIEYIKKTTGVDLSINYALARAKDDNELKKFITEGIWNNKDKSYTYDSYLSKFGPGDKIALNHPKAGMTFIEAIGTIVNYSVSGNITQYKIKWDRSFQGFHPDINTTIGMIDFFQIVPGENEYGFADIKKLFYANRANQESMKQPLNQILFGAPGTSKTYQTKKIAIEIIDNIDYSSYDREDILKRYDELYTLGQINFTTFHQSISYEDFIEGIKPIISSQDDDSEKSESKNGSIEYEVKDGIFKKLSNTAKGVSGNIENNQAVDFQNKKFYKMSLGGKHRLDRHNWSIDNDLIFLGWGGENDFTHLNGIKNWKQFREQFKEEFPQLVEESKYVIQAVYIFQKMEIGDIVLVSKGNKVIDAIGIIESDYFYDDTKDVELFQFRKVRWLAKNMNASPELFVSKAISQQTIYEFYNQDIKLEEFVDYFNKPANDKEHKKYVLIIDEINRGNVSSIFGELITLIETEKRKGIKTHNPEFIEVELPYSNDKFSVPDNLYIIGTMNTADRSVEALDTALRRRFSFVEMQAKPELLLTEHPSKGIIAHSDKTEINLISILKNINERIELLIDKDHQIGHSFFIKAKTFDDLKSVFKDSIIPLLEEYFFGDFGKIGLVLGGEFIKAKSSKPSFPKNFKYGEDGDISSFTDKIVYEFTPVASWSATTFTSIYE